jgi:hypothetical protein
MDDICKEMPHKRLLSMSAASRTNVDEVVERTYKFLSKLKSDRLLEDNILKSAQEDDLTYN